MCKNVCLLGFAILSIRKEGRASVVICVCVYWRGTASQLSRARMLQMRPNFEGHFESTMGLADLNLCSEKTQVFLPSHLLRGENFCFF